MRRALIDDDGVLDLGDEARRAGFTPGAIVDVRVSSSGSLHVSLSDDLTVIDLDASRLPSGMAGKAVTGRTR